MAIQLLFTSVAKISLLILILSIAISIAISIINLRQRRTSPSQTLTAAKSADDCPAYPELTILGKSLKAALPDSIIFPHNAAAFKQATNCYWAQQECEAIPECIVRPHDVQQLCTAVTLLKLEYDEQRKQAGEEQAGVLFAIRSGGHSPNSGFASTNGGVLIDLSLFCEVTPSEDGSSVVIGAGAKWRDVSRVLDQKGLAVVGGRNSDVGVGGLTLGGGLSFFSPRFGMVCSNIISYEVVLASGTIVNSSVSTNPDLWCALKGGSNNFGIVTRFTARSFPCSGIWSGFLYMPAFQSAKVLKAFYECVKRADSDDPSIIHDNHAVGPMVCMSYIQEVGAQVISVNLASTKLPENQNKWPVYWKSSSFGSLWSIWSTCKIRTLTSAMDEMHALSPCGRRQLFATTTIKNDPATITTVHSAYNGAITPLRRANVKELVWTLVLQPFLPKWLRKGDVNPLGLDAGTNEALVLVCFTVNWAESNDDEFVKMTTHRIVEQIDTFAIAHRTSHPYRFLNYCAEWQKPFESYGEENLHFLRGVSRKYDPEGLFQKGCVGGFKLGMLESSWITEQVLFELRRHQRFRSVRSSPVSP